MAADEPASRPAAALSLRTAARALVGRAGALAGPDSVVDWRAAAPDAGAGTRGTDRASGGPVHVSSDGRARRRPRGDGRLVRPAIRPAAPRSCYPGAPGER